MLAISHDGSFDLAVGQSRNSLHWKNQEWLWSALVEKVSTTHRTAETHTQYIAAKKDRQTEIKDIGGFVGGYLTGGKRTSSSILHRQLITLDIDFCDNSFWDTFTLLYSSAALIYSTHKHAANSPRLRLIMPLSRAVQPDEYEAISRKIAGSLDIEIFDTTTFQANRLMFWPSTPKDGDFQFEYQDGQWLDVDNVLKSYQNWKDSSGWPVSVKVNTLIERTVTKQGDPLDKTGVVGAFCRTYSIQEVIETYLSDLYAPCDLENRYTYKEGSTYAGLIVYEDKYAYSHHGTDPTNGKLCNAFDLVRLHKFGLKDEDAKENTPSNKLPSYISMLDLASKDGDVRKRLVSEKMAGATSDFNAFIGGEDAEAEAFNDDWKADLEVDRKGNISATISNIALILENDALLKDCFATDVFLKKKVILKNLPWRKVSKDNRFLKDEDDQNLIKYLEKMYNLMNRANTKDAFDTHIDNLEIHPIKNYLSGLVWDGVKRLDSFFIDYLGAANSPYIRAVTRKTLAAAVARIYQPGIKFDYVLTLIGEQGIGKSSIIAKLGGEWFSDSFNFNMLHTKEAYEQIQGVWLVEMGELAGLRKAEVEAAKQFISKQEDSFRRAYGRNVVTFKRQCVFFGSTNNRDFLTDPTGNRRFWPVDTMLRDPIKSIYKDLDQEEIGQIWAEAVEAYKAKEPLFLDKELEKEASGIQKQHSEKDERTGIIEKYLDKLLPNDWDEMDIYARRNYIKGDELQAEGTLVRNRVCAAEIWCECLLGNEKDLSRQNAKDLHNIMRNLEGWSVSATRLRFNKYGLQTTYLRENKKYHKNGTTSDTLAKSSKTVYH